MKLNRKLNHSVRYDKRHTITRQARLLKERSVIVDHTITWSSSCNFNCCCLKSLLIKLIQLQSSTGFYWLHVLLVCCTGLSGSECDCITVWLLMLVRHQGIHCALGCCDCHCSLSTDIRVRLQQASVCGFLIMELQCEYVLLYHAHAEWIT